MSIPDNPHIAGAFFKAIGYIDQSKKYAVSVSGGSDSDIVLDFMVQCDCKNAHYIFFDTGLEYEATKKHITYLENRYNITIERIKAYKPIPACCKEYGVPFINKFVSENIERLQKHDFKWEDKPLEELLKDYPGCTSSIYWWTNNHKFPQWNINYKKYLKEFLIDNPPTFSISSKCCTYAKKKTAKKLYKDLDPDVVVTGLRSAEGGIRQAAFSSCYSVGKPDTYRPIWWFTNEDKAEYNRFYKIKNSECYTKYGFKRTGCACCPFGLELEEELLKTKKYEPKLYKAVLGVFGKSYDYTRQYYKFRAEKENQNARDIRKTLSLEEYGII